MDQVQDPNPGGKGLRRGRLKRRESPLLTQMERIKETFIADVVGRNGKQANEFDILICREEGDKVLINLDQLTDWSIVPANLPMPQDLKVRSSKVRNIKEAVKGVKLTSIKERQTSLKSQFTFHTVDEDTINLP